MATTNETRFNAYKMSSTIKTRVVSMYKNDAKRYVEKLAITKERDSLPQQHSSNYEFWMEVWKIHPENLFPSDSKTQITAWDKKFDWQRFIYIRDLVHILTENIGLKELPSHDENKNKDKIFTYYVNDKQEHNIYVNTFDVLAYDPRHHFKFTVGNMEAALWWTRRIWESRIDRLHFRKKREVMFSICSEFLRELQTKMNGYNEDWRMRYESIAILAGHEVQQNLEKDEVIGEPVVVKLREERSPFRWYPSLKAFEHVQHKPKRDMWETLAGSYFADLQEVYIRIGRPDLAARISAPIRVHWLYVKNVRAMETITSEDFKNLEAQMDEQNMPSVRTKALREISNAQTLLDRHYDKMYIFCHRGRFSYLRGTDMLLFYRQKQAINKFQFDSGTRFATMMFASKDSEKRENYKKLPIPHTYVEEAAAVKKYISTALITQDYEDVWKACEAVIILKNRWKDMICLPYLMKDPEVTAWEAQADEKPVVKSAGAPSGGAASDPTAAKDVNTPITKGEKHATTTFVDQRTKEATVSKVVKTGQKPATSVREGEYKIPDITNKPMQLYKTTWTTSQNLGDSILPDPQYGFMVPQVYFDAFDKTKPVACAGFTVTNVLAMFGACRFDMKFKIKLNTTKFQQGMLIAYFKPYYDSSRKTDLFHNATQWDHVLIDAAQSQPVEITVPFTNVRDVMPLYVDDHAEINYFGTFHVDIWNKLQTGATGSTDATVTIFAWIENVELFQQTLPRPSPTIQFATKVRGPTVKGTSDNLKQNKKLLYTVSTWEAQALERVLDTGVQVATELGVGLVESLLQKVTAGLCDKPGITAPPRPVYPQITANPSLGKGIDLGHRLSLHPATVTARSPEAMKPITMKDLISKWSRVRIMNWTTAAEENARLAIVPVSPTLNCVDVTQSYEQKLWGKTVIQTYETVARCELQQTKDQINTWDRHGSMLDYIAKDFWYWRGSLKWKLEVVATAMHSGMLSVRYEPFGSYVPKDECHKFATPIITFDLMEKHALEWETPYASTQPWMHCNYVNEGDAATVANYLNANGIMEISVVNKLKVTTGVSSAVSINLYVAAGDDFRFAVPGPLDGILDVRRDFNTGDGSSLRGTSRTTMRLKALEQLFFTMSSHMFERTKPDDVTRFAIRWKSQVLEGSDKWYWAETKISDSAFLAFWNPFVIKTRYARLFLLAQAYGDVDKALTTNHGKEKDTTLDLPIYRTIEEALAHLVDVREALDNSDMAKIATKLKKTWTEHGKNVYYFWLAFMAMRDRTEFVEKFPLVPSSDLWMFGTRGTKDPAISKTWNSETDDIALEAQGKESAVGPTIDPFKNHTVPPRSDKSLFGEDFMQIYTPLKRFQEWGNVVGFPPDTLGWPYGSTDILDAMKSDLGVMSPFERAKLCLMYSIPVTPALEQHRIGMKEHSWTTWAFQGSAYPITDTTLPLNLTSYAGLVKFRKMADLFTFWRGSMRYKIVVEDGTDENGKPWVIYMVHHPRYFSTWEDSRFPRLVSKNYMRDMTAMGSTMMSGIQQTTHDIEVPYYSKYDHLSISQQVLDETTTNGSLLIFVPFHVTTAWKCIQTSRHVDPNTISIETPSFNIWTAVGDDFEFFGMRAAPKITVWDKYKKWVPSWTERTVGYDTPLSGSNKELYDLEQVINVRESVNKEWQKGFKRIVYREIDAGDPVDGISVAESLLRKHRWLKMVDLSEDKDEKEKPALEAQMMETDLPPPILPPVPSTSGQDVVGTMSAATSTVTLPVQEQAVSADDVDGAISAIIRASQTLPEAVEGFRSVVSLATEFLQEARSATATTESRVIEAAAEVANTTSRIKTGATWVFNATRIGIFFKSMVDILNASSWEERWIPLATAALALGMSADLMKSAGEWMTAFATSVFGSGKVTENTGLGAQAYEDTWNQSWEAFLEEHSTILKFLAAGIVTIATFWMTTSQPCTSKVTDFANSMIHKLKNFAIVGGAIKTLDWLFRWVANVIQTAFLTVADWMTGNQITAYRMAVVYPEVVAWVKKTELYKQEAVKNQVAWDANARLDLWKAMDEGEALIKRLTVKSGSMFSTLMSGMKVLTNTHDAALVSAHTAPFRVDPFHVCLTGEPGVGKSAIMSFIMGIVCDHLGFPKTHRFYSRAEEDDYWTNYMGQPCVLIDDLFSDKKAMAIKELIKMKSNAAWPLNMAQIEEKGRAFISKLIGSTTNVDYPTPDDIMCREALWRRRNMLIKVRWVNNVTAGTAPKWADLRFDIMNPLGRQGAADYIRRDLSIEQIIKVTCESAQKFLNVQQKLVFAALEGRVIEMSEYGDVGQPPPAVTSIGETIKDLCMRKIRIKPTYLKELLNLMKWEDWLMVQELLKRDEEYEPLVRKFELELLPKLLWEELEDYLGDSHRPTRQAVCILQVLVDKGNVREITHGEVFELRLIVKGRDVDGAKKMIQCTGEQATLWPNNDMPETDGPIEHWQFVERTEWEDQAGEDVLQDLINVDIDRKVEASEELSGMIREQIVKRERLMDGFDEVVDRVSRRPIRKKKITLANENEIKNFVATNFIELSPDQQKKMVSNLSTVFNMAQENGRVKMQEEIIKSEQYSNLFSLELQKYWKKNGEDWVMVFDDDFVESSDEGAQLACDYEWLKQTWTQEQINQQKNMTKTPIKLNETQAMKGLKGWYNRTTARVKKFFEDHPYVAVVLKVSATLAAIFASYKLLSFICPKIVDKIKMGWAFIFGWTTSKLGEERVARISTTYDQAVGKIGDYKKQVMSYLMRTSRDPELVEAADDPEKVTLMAEGMEREMQNAKVLMKLRNVQPEMRQVNPYYTGQDQIIKTRFAGGLPMTHQGADDSVTTSLRRSKIIPNTVRIVWTDGSTVLELTAVFIKDRVLLVPGHFFQVCPPGTIFAVTNYQGVQWFDTYQPERKVMIPDQDACIYLCSKRIAQHKSLMGHFIQMTDLHGRTTVPASLNLMTSTGSVLVHPTTAELDYEASYTVKGVTVRNAFAWKYVVPTQKGDCGAMLLAETSTMQRKIMGIHVCGNPTKSIGGAAIIFREQIDQALDLLPKDDLTVFSTIVPEGLLTCSLERSKYVPQGNFTVLGCVAPSKEVRLPHKTEIEPSPIHDMVREHVTEPAVLTRNDPRNESGKSPLANALKKYGTPTIPFNPYLLEYVRQDLASAVMTWERPMPARKLSDHEAVFGNDTIEYCDRMNLQASPGYPWINTRPSGEKGKEYLYDYNSEDGIRCEKYRHEYIAREKLAKAGIRKNSIWTDCLKDERRPMAKIVAGKTRAFVLPPADYVQLCRKYTMAFSVAFYANHTKSFSAVGIDPYSYEWTILTRKLRRVSNKGFGGDFHGFDGILDPDLVSGLCRIVNDWYQKFDPDCSIEDQRVREVLFDEMVHTAHICLNTVYIKHQGNPSGNPLTVILNTFAHAYYIRLAWLSIMMKQIGEMNIEGYHKRVAEVIYGDDGLFAVEGETSKWFNLKTVAEELALHGIEYTSESKTEDLYGVQPLTECTFLKNGFRLLEGTRFWLAPIAKDTIYELTNWIRKSDDPVLQMRENLDNAKKFAFHHGREFYDGFCSAVNEALATRNLRCIPYSYEIDRAVFEDRCRV